MKKSSKRVVSLIILATFIAALAIGVYAGIDLKKDDDKYVYTVLGDSIAAGFGYADDQTYYYQVVDESYPDIIRDRLCAAYGEENVEINMGACAALSSSMIRRMVEPGFVCEDSIQELVGQWLVDATFNAGEAEKAADFNEKLQQSDLVTLQIGSNDILTYPLLYLTLSGYAADLEAYGIDLQERNSLFGKTIKLISEKIAAGSSIEGVLGVITALDGFLANIKYNYYKWTENMPVIISSVRQNNQKATVVICGMYNPVKNVRIVDDLSLTLGNLTNLLIESMNLKMKQWAREYGCLYVDVSDTKSYFDYYEYDELELGNAYNHLLYDCHPTMSDVREKYGEIGLTGHEYLAEQIINAVENVRKVQVDVPQGAEYITATVDGKSAPIDYYDGKAYVSVNGTRAQLLNVKAYKNVNDKIAAENATYKLSYKKGAYNAVKLFSIGKMKIGFKLDFSLLKSLLKGIIK